ncbi:MAG TPA: hypothetical protein H9828_04025 [Candidatus Alistipes intestinigallinarum]|uniref:Uncharacterized protein n=1 Tax=Candidatus Alistipes intestinigallinarum TaxID=2838440 RepID=A0A9D1Z0P4_9BACT|nr:hypothetical protein [Candidatus Alistipes intestinigallinarum]
MFIISRILGWISTKIKKAGGSAKQKNDVFSVGRGRAVSIRGKGLNTKKSEPLGPDFQNLQSGCYDPKLS